VVSAADPLRSLISVFYSSLADWGSRSLFDCYNENHEYIVHFTVTHLRAPTHTHTDH
jgi:hypothetical protein